MVRVCRYNYHDLQMNLIWFRLNLWGTAPTLPSGNPNPEVAANASSERKTLAREREQRKKRIFSIIKSLVSGGGWVTIGDIGLAEFKLIMRRIYALEEWDQHIRCKLHA